jgi:predicted RNA-binding Zn ribbon-like protein
VKHAFLSGDPALDLAGTLRARRSGTPCDVLDSPESLHAWYLQSGLVDAAPPCGADDLAQAVRVREAIYALVTARLGDAPYDERDLAPVNAAARTPVAAPQLTATGRRTEGTPAQALSAVARHAIELLGGPDAALMKECAHSECTRVYVDRSRGRRREWCGMESCGNKIKAAAYRARKRRAGAATTA